jgi:hypothetical protein
VRCAIAHADGQIIWLQRACAVLLGRLEMARQGEDMAVLESLVDDICRVDLTIQGIVDGQPLDRALRIDPAARARVALERPPADEQPLLRVAA